MNQFILKQYKDIKKSGLIAFNKKLMAVYYLIRLLYRHSRRQAWCIFDEVNLVCAIKYNFLYSKKVKPGKVNTAQSPRKIIFFTCVWGSFVTYYERVLMKSLFQSGNIPALLEQGYLIELCVYTQESDQLAVENIMKRYQDGLLDAQKQFLQIQLNYFPLPILNRSQRQPHLKYALLRTMKWCIQENAYCFMALPEAFFGNNSVTNMVNLTMGRDLCIASLHLRVVDQKFLNLLQQSSGELSNNTLVSMSLKCAHQGVLNSFINHDVNGSYSTGLSIQPITNTLFAVTFRMPNIFLASFHKSDITYFSKRTFNHWDHEWPELLMKQRRYKVAGSSELFFAAELTGEDSHWDISLNKKQVYGNDSAQRHASHCFHTEIHRNFVMLLKGQEPLVISQ